MSERAKVFGIGYMKTGTTTLAACFSTLGYRHFSYYPKLIRQLRRGERDELWAVADAYESFEDHPWPEVYEELDERYPDAKFVLTVRRDSETWFRSLADHAGRRGPTAEKFIIFGHGWPKSDERGLIAQYERHNRDVVEHFRDRPDKLLVVCWEDGSSWSDVARFVDAELPESQAPPPKRNAAADQRLSVIAWVRNVAKYVIIGRIGVDPFRHRHRSR